MAGNWSDTASTGSSLTSKLNVTSALKLVCKEALRQAIDCCKNESCTSFVSQDTVQGLKGG